MKACFSPLFVARLLPLVALLMAAGCASKSNYSQADRTGSQLASLKRDVQDIRSSVEGTMTALESVVAAANTDPRKSYERFAKAVGGVDKADARARAQADKMRAEGKQFFAEWEAEMAAIKDDELRNLAAQRRAELEKIFRNISFVTVEVKDRFRPWLSDVKDLERFLASDLTPAGIAAAQPKITQAQTDSQAVIGSLNKLAAEIERVSVALTPASGS